MKRNILIGASLILIFALYYFFPFSRSEKWYWHHDNKTDIAVFSRNTVVLERNLISVNDDGEFSYLMKSTSYEVTDVISHIKNAKMKLYVLKDDKGWHLLPFYENKDTLMLDLGSVDYSFKDYPDMRKMLNQKKDFTYRGIFYHAKQSDMIMSAAIVGSVFTKR
jgi:hypothetical protein